MKVGDLVNYYDRFNDDKRVGLVIDIRPRGWHAGSDITVLWSDGDYMLCSERELRIADESR